MIREKEMNERSYFMNECMDFSVDMFFQSVSMVFVNHRSCCVAWEKRSANVL